MSLIAHGTWKHLKFAYLPDVLDSTGPWSRRDNPSVERIPSVPVFCTARCLRCGARLPSWDGAAVCVNDKRLSCGHFPPPITSRTQAEARTFARRLRITVHDAIQTAINLALLYTV